MKEENFNAVHKFYPLLVNPQMRSLEANLHILHLLSLMIEKVPPGDLIKVMMPKLEPYLSSLKVSDELFYTAESCVKRIMKKLEVSRNMNEVIQLEYDAEYFKFDLP